LRADEQLSPSLTRQAPAMLQSIFSTDFDLDRLLSFALPRPLPPLRRPPTPAVRAPSQQPVACRQRAATGDCKCQEPLRAELDIRTAHIILDYMEMHLSDKQKLREEWEELQEAARQPHQQDGRLFSAATRPENADKNRRPDRLPYDRTRVRLLPDTPGASDYINASLVQDSACLPRHLRGDGGGGGGGHILTQSPLTATIGEFWRLVWQTGATGLVNLARPGEPGLPDYWPDRGCAQFGGFQVHLVSEHVCSDHFVIRSLRVRPLAAAGAERRRLGPARTVTQFHYLSWEEAGVPPSTSSLLEFR
uniref:Tyrosine-protein phosphatase domain-containing protein n=1 Tax=Macrostomum lignano TaxID=282301 RepID=A0A1I8JMS9_9PLAT